MHKHTFHFFAAAEDNHLLLDDFDPLFPLTVILHRFSGINQIVSYDNLLAIPKLGYLSVGDWVRSDSYFVANCETNIFLEEYPLISGEIFYRLNRFEFFEFRPSGLYNESTMIAGRIACMTEDDNVLLLYKSLIKRFKKMSQCINSFWLAPNALALFDNGMNFKTDVRDNPLERPPTK